MKLTFWTAMFLVFLTLKLCGVLQWSWWWVTIPLWGPFILGMIGIGLINLSRYLESPQQKLSRELKEYSKRINK